ncbi:MAG: hypothetical protein HY906_08130 [Deltaproteobacteria bacterium]|nr:hypothetical protein [Deltaproteobacteria bacterium]
MVFLLFRVLSSLRTVEGIVPFRWVAARVLTVCLLVLGSAGCRQTVTMTETAEGNASFGEAMFEVMCERVGYSHELDVKAAQPEAAIDVSGDKYHAACTAPGDQPAAATDAPKVNVLVGQREALIRALNIILPEELLDPVDAFLRAILPLYDDGTFGDANGKIGMVLRLLADDTDLHAALAKFTGRDGYRPLEAALGVVRKVVEYPDIDTVLSASLRSLDEGGTGHEAFTALTTALHYELTTAKAVPDAKDPERTLNLALGLFFAEDAQSRFGSGPSRLLVRRDHRGLARVAKPSGTLPTPFADLNGDGLPDVDGAGRFIDRNGQPLLGYWPFPTKDGSGSGARDSQGRLLGSGGQPIYEYLDLNNTLLAGTLRDSLTIFDPGKDTALGLVRGAGALMGPRRTVTRDYLLPDGHTQTMSFNGFDGAQAALLELLYAVVQLLGAPEIDEALEATQLLIDQHEDPTAWLLGAALGMKEFAKRPGWATASIPEASTLYDDLLPVLRRVLANEALTADLMDALRDPITQNLGRIHSFYMTYTDRWDPNPNDINAPPIGGFTKKPNYGAADSAFNRTQNHRLFHLIHDTNGARLCSKAGAVVEVFGIGVATYDAECELFQIDSLGKFYVQSMARVWDPEVNAYTPKAQFPMNLKWPLTWASRSLMDSTLESESGITGFKTRPTTESLNRVIFFDPTPTFITNMQNDPLCIDGDKLKTAHAGTIMAWEVKARDLNFTPAGTYDPDESLFYQSIRPIVNAFAKYDEEGLFLDLLSVFYHHWSTNQSTECQFTNPTAARFCYGDGAMRYEPLVAALFDPLNTSVYPGAPPYAFDLMRALHASAPALGDLKLGAGRAARPELLRVAGWLLNPQPGLTHRDGTAQITYDRLVPYDGHDRHEQGSENLSGYELMASALKAKRQALASAGENATAWNGSTSNLVDLFLAVDPTVHKFQNRRFVATTMQLVPFVRGRISKHQGTGDLGTWLKTTLPKDFQDALTNPVFAALYDLAQALAGDEEARNAVYGLVGYLIDEAHQSEAFAVALTAAADLVQLIIDDADLVAILRAAGRVLDPTLGVAAAQVKFLHRAQEQDGELVLTQILRNLWQKYGTGDTPFGTFADVTSAVHRVTPGAFGEPLQAPDYQEIFGQAAGFVDDNERGLQHFVDVVKSRKLKK